MSGVEKQKKSKKSKESKEEVPAVVAAEEKDVAIEDDAAKAERKKKKKERKAAEAAAAAAAGVTESEEVPKKKKARTEEPVAAEVAAPVEEEKESAEAKAKRKAEKKARKAAEAAAAAEASTSSDDLSSLGGRLVEEKKTAAVVSTDGYSTGPKHFRRAFYQQHAEVTAMTTAQVDAIRAELKVTIHCPAGSKKGSPIAPHDDIRPLATFAQSNLPSGMLKCVAGFAKPTAIQSQCWPAILQGRDVIGIAETGSGKTLGFMLPALIHILDQPKLGKGDRNGPIMLTLSPTRELAMQTQVVAESTGGELGIKSTCIYGGVDKHAQKRILKDGVHIVVATPGRLLGLIEEGALTLSRVTYLVLDEADRMLDLGFEPDIRRIVGLVGTERQTLLFSATWPASIQALGREFVVNPFHVTIGNAGGEQLAANHRVKQVIEVIEPFKRDGRLLELLKQYHGSRKNRVIIFVLYKKEVDRVEQWLKRNGWDASGISGDKGQADRTNALAAFKDGSKPLLIATDVAARGLDIPAVEHVLNYSFPLTIEDYVHRIGRTGRGGAMGHSHTFFTTNDKHLAGELAGVLNEAGEAIPPALQAFGLITKKKEHALYGSHFKKDDKRPMAEKKHMKFD